MEALGGGRESLPIVLGCVKSSHCCMLWGLMFVCYIPTPVSVHDLPGYNGHVNILNLELVGVSEWGKISSLLYTLKKTLRTYREEKGEGITYNLKKGHFNNHDFKVAKSYTL